MALGVLADTRSCGGEFAVFWGFSFLVSKQQRCKLWLDLVCILQALFSFFCVLNRCMIIYLMLREWWKKNHLSQLFGDVQGRKKHLRI